MCSVGRVTAGTWQPSSSRLSARCLLLTGVACSRGSDYAEGQMTSVDLSGAARVKLWAR